MLTPRSLRPHPCCLPEERSEAAPVAARLEVEGVAAASIRLSEGVGEKAGRHAGEAEAPPIAGVFERRRRDGAGATRIRHLGEVRVKPAVMIFTVSAEADLDGVT
jgi:hypothetical protein